MKKLSEAQREFVVNLLVREQCRIRQIKQPYPIYGGSSTSQSLMTKKIVRWDRNTGYELTEEFKAPMLELLKAEVDKEMAHHLWVDARKNFLREKLNGFGENLKREFPSEIKSVRLNNYDEGESGVVINLRHGDITFWHTVYPHFESRLSSKITIEATCTGDEIDELAKRLSMYKEIESRAAAFAMDMPQLSDFKPVENDSEETTNE